MKKIIGIIAMLGMFFPLVALAADFRSGQNTNVGENESLRNLYTAGQSVTVDADIASDLVVAGGTVNVNGNVENSLMAAGGDVNIKGDVGRNARIAGNTITVDGNVGEDLVIFGGQVVVNSSSTVIGDLIVYGGTVDLRGKINGNVYGSAGQISFNGTVGRNVNLDESGRVTVGSSAVIQGDFNYSANSEATIQSGATINGKTNFKKVNNTEKWQGIARLGSFFWIATIVGSFFLLLLITWLAPRFSKEFVINSYKSVWANLGIGFVVLVAAPVLMVLLAITVFGLPIAGFSFLTYIVLTALAGILSALLIGSLVYKLISKDGDYEINWKAVGLGVIIVALLKIIPVLGWLVVFFFFLVAFGGIIPQTFSVLKAHRS